MPYIQLTIIAYGYFSCYNKPDFTITRHDDIMYNKACLKHVGLLAQDKRTVHWSRPIKVIL